MENKESKLTESELAEINELRLTIGENIDIVGNLHIRKYFLEKDMKSLEEEIKKVLQRTEELNALEKQKIDEIIQKYGEGRLDFQTGIFYTN
jgi:hypothetical protein